MPSLKRNKIDYALAKRYTNLPDAVAQLAQVYGQHRAARIMSDETGVEISQSDLSRYLRRHYKLVIHYQYVKKEGE